MRWPRSLAKGWRRSRSWWKWDSAVAGFTRRSRMFSKDQDSALSFARGLFFGLIEENLVFPYPEMKAEETETLDMLFEQVDRFMADKVNSSAIDQAGDLPVEIRQGVADLGLMGLVIPEEYGGIGMSMTGYAHVMEHLTRHDASLAIHVGCHQSIGIKALLLHGSEEQKKRWFPKCATGEIVCAFALTEPGAGS